MVDSGAIEAPLLPVQTGRLLPADRKRLSAPSIRTFLAIADQWRLTDDQRRKVLGSPSPSTYMTWCRKASAGSTLLLSLNALTRLSHLFGIQAALGTLFTDQRSAVEWLHTIHAAPPFDGEPPINLMAGDHLDGLAATRRFLAAAEQGVYMPPNGVDVGSAPYTDDEIQLR